MSTNAVMSTVGRFQASDIGLNYVGVSSLYCVSVRLLKSSPFSAQCEKEQSILEWPWTYFVLFLTYSRVITPIDCWNCVAYIHYNISMFTQNMTLFQERQQQHMFQKAGMSFKKRFSNLRVSFCCVCFCVLDHCVICVSLIIFNPGQSYSFRIVQPF